MMVGGENGLQRIQRARPDVSDHDPQRPSVNAAIPVFGTGPPRGLLAASATPAAAGLPTVGMPEHHMAQRHSRQWRPREAGDEQPAKSRQWRRRSPANQAGEDRSVAGGQACRG
jgi:hypothetical protein